MKDINVIYQFNEKYVPYAGVSLTSVLENNKSAETLNVYILGEGISEGSEKLLEQEGIFISPKQISSLKDSGSSGCFRTGELIRYI